jgi:PAS domain S-box-containing protein
MAVTLRLRSRAADGRDDSIAAQLEELEELYQHAPVGLCTVDRELRFVYANQHYTQIIGYSLEQLVGLSLHDVVSESARGPTIDSATRVIETGEPLFNLEIRRDVPEHPERSQVWLVNSHPVRHDGQVVGATAVLQEVTEIRRAEEIARRRLAELESVYRNAPVGLSLIDTELRYLRVNQVIADMNGLSIDEIVGQTYRELSPETADIAEPLLKGIMERSDSVRNLPVRSPIPTDPESVHDFLLSMEPVRDARDTVVAYTTTVQDVTELRRTERNAAQRLEELESLYAILPVGICHVSADLRIVNLNALFARLSDRPRDEQLGALLEDVLPEAICSDLMPQIRNVARLGAYPLPIEIETPPKDPGARASSWLAQAHPIISAEGAVTGVIVILQDVTTLAQHQREIEVMRDHLTEAQGVARIGSWKWNLIDDVVWWSPELFTIFGEDASYQPSYDGVYDHVHPEDQATFREQLDRALSEDEPYRVTFRARRPDGQEIVLFAAARLERTDDGRPARFVGTCQDVTDFGPRAQRRKKRRRASR